MAPLLPTLQTVKVGTWWGSPLVVLKQEDHRFEASMNYTVSEPLD